MLIEDLRRSWPRRDARHPFRTRKLRPGTAMVLHPRGCGRVAHRRIYTLQGAPMETIHRGSTHIRTRIPTPTHNNRKPNKQSTPSPCRDCPFQLRPTGIHRVTLGTFIVSWVGSGGRDGATRRVCAQGVDEYAPRKRRMYLSNENAWPLHTKIGRAR